MHKTKIMIGMLVVLAVVLALLPACESAAPTATAKPAAPTAAAAATPTKAAATTPAPVATVAPIATVVKGDSTGVTDTQIMFGGSVPLSGPVSVAGTIGKAIDSYFKYVNDQGGINGRKLVMKLYDDAYTPAKTVQVTKQAVEDDKVFAMVGSVGSAAQIGVRDYLNEKKVPQLFIASGLSTFALDYKKYPWTIGGAIVNYTDESIVYAKYILANMPNAKVGIIYQNDDAGKEYLNSFKAALGDKAKTLIVGEQSFEATSPDMSSQLQNLKTAGTNLLFSIPAQGASPKILTGAATLGWFPDKILASMGSGLGAIGVVAPDASKGLLSTAFYKDPSDPEWASDAGMKLHKDIMAKYYPEGTVADAQNIFGHHIAWITEQLLKAIGKDVTRENLMKGATSMNFANAPFLLPGIVVKTTPTDVQPIRALQMMKFNGTRYERFGSVIDARSN